MDWKKRRWSGNEPAAGPTDDGKFRASRDIFFPSAHFNVPAIPRTRTLLLLFFFFLGHCSFFIIIFFFPLLLYRKSANRAVYFIRHARNNRAAAYTAAVERRTVRRKSHGQADFRSTIRSSASRTRARTIIYPLRYLFLYKCIFFSFFFCTTAFPRHSQPGRFPVTHSRAPRPTTLRRRIYPGPGRFSPTTGRPTDRLVSPSSDRARTQRDYAGTDNVQFWFLAILYRKLRIAGFTIFQIDVRAVVYRSHVDHVQKSRKYGQTGRGEKNKRQFIFSCSHDNTWTRRQSRINNICGPGLTYLWPYFICQISFYVAMIVCD